MERTIDVERANREAVSHVLRAYHPRERVEDMQCAILIERAILEDQRMKQERAKETATVPFQWSESAFGEAARR